MTGKTAECSDRIRPDRKWATPAALGRQPLLGVRRNATAFPRGTGVMPNNVAQEFCNTPLTVDMELTSSGLVASALAQGAFAKASRPKFCNTGARTLQKSAEVVRGKQCVVSGQDQSTCELGCRAAHAIARRCERTSNRILEHPALDPRQFALSVATQLQACTPLAARALHGNNATKPKAFKNAAGHGSGAGGQSCAQPLGVSQS